KGAMWKNKFSVFSLLTLAAVLMAAPLANAIVFGSDNRQEVIQNPVMKELARPTAMMISPVYMTNLSPGHERLDFPLLKDPDGIGVCEDERFSSQPVFPLACT